VEAFPYVKMYSFIAVVSDISGAILASQLTCDLAEMVCVEPISCSDYAAAVINEYKEKK